VRIDPEARKTFVKHVQILIADPQPDLWFQDETAFWADPAPYKVWAPRGTRPVIPRLVTHDHVNVFGAMRPADGKLFAVIASHGNHHLFQIFLDLMQEQINRSRRTIMVLDNVPFHKVKELNWGRIEPLYLPVYSPDLNPIETLWLGMKKRFFNGWVPKKNDPLDERVFDAIQYYRERQKRVKRTCAITAYL